MQVTGESVYLTAAAFGGSGTITLTDLYDGTDNKLNYKIVGTSTAGYLNNYSGSYTSATFKSLSTDSSGKTYQFTASGINNGITIGGHSTAAGLSVITATYVGATGSEQFNLSGLSVGMVFGGDSITANETLTSFKLGSASVIDVTGISTGNINVMVYAGALSATARTDISLTGGDTYSLSLASDLLLLSNGAPSVLQAGAASVTFANNASSAVWFANTYKDYYSITSNNYATHYKESGGQSFQFFVKDSTGSVSTGFNQTIAIGSVSEIGSVNASGQYEIVGFEFGVSKAFLGELKNNGDVLTVASLSSGAAFNGTYGFTFTDGTSSTYTKGMKEVLTTVDSGAASFATTATAGTYNFTASIAEYAWYEKIEENNAVHGISFHEQKGGASFSITGLNKDLGALTYNESTGVITAKDGSVIVGSISFAPNGDSGNKYGYVYLTADAFDTTNSVTLTDSNKWDDKVYYQLAAYETSGTNYLTATGTETTVASFNAVEGKTYIYTAAITGQGVSATADNNSGSTTLTYIARSGGQSFTITGLAENLNVSAVVNATNNNVTDIISQTTKTILGSVSVSGKTGTFTLKSREVMGLLSSGQTQDITLTDNNNSDSIDYSLSLDAQAFNYSSTHSIEAAKDFDVVEEGNTGTYNVVIKGTPAYASLIRENQYAYHAAGGSNTYMVTGLKSGLSTTLSQAALSSIFGETTVMISASAVPSLTSTIHIVNDSTGKVSLAHDGTIATKSLSVMSGGSATHDGTHYTMNTYMPWTDDTNMSDGLTVYPQVGGQSFTFTGLNVDNTSGLSVVGDDLIVSGATVGNVSVSLGSDGQIAQYTFTISGRSAIEATLTDNSSISITRNNANDTVPYAFIIEKSAIVHNTGTSVGSATLTYSSQQHTYKSTGRTEYVTAGNDSHSYTYHSSLPSAQLIITNLNPKDLTLDTDISIEEKWSGNTLSGTNVTLHATALNPESIGGDIA